MNLLNRLGLNDYDAMQISEPNWEQFDRELVHVHDWRRYISREIRSIWIKLSSDARILAYAMAKEQAENEEWD